MTRLQLEADFEDLPDLQSFLQHLRDWEQQHRHVQMAVKMDLPDRSARHAEEIMDGLQPALPYKRLIPLLALCLIVIACRATTHPAPPQLVWDLHDSQASYFQICTRSIAPSSTTCRKVEQPVVTQEGRTWHYAAVLTTEEKAALRQGATLSVQACTATGICQDSERVTR
jgi:hypothetical protein